MEENKCWIPPLGLEGPFWLPNGFAFYYDPKTDKHLNGFTGEEVTRERLDQMYHEAVTIGGRAGSQLGM